MELDLSDDLDRMVYFLGRYYDLDLQLLLDELLRPGDTFINVGANVGYVVLHAASRVGPRGRVIAFEPQPGCCRKLRRNPGSTASNTSTFTTAPSVSGRTSSS